MLNSAMTKVSAASTDIAGNQRRSPIQRQLKIKRLNPIQRLQENPWQLLVQQQLANKL